MTPPLHKKEKLCEACKNNEHERCVNYVCFPRCDCDNKFHKSDPQPVPINEEEVKHIHVQVASGNYVLAWDSRCEKCKEGIKCNKPYREMTYEELPIVSPTEKEKELLQIVIEDVPHQYQGRLLEKLKSEEK